MLEVLTFLSGCSLDNVQLLGQ